MTIECTGMCESPSYSVSLSACFNGGRLKKKKKTSTEMGNEYNRLRTQKALFVPLLCSRPSVKDAIQRKSVLRSESFAGDPLSPRITCIGQLKKPSDSNEHCNQTTINNNVNYLKLKKLLPGKNVITTASISVEVQTRKHRVRNGVGWPEKGLKYEKQGRFSVVDADMDPPLPVIKKVKNKGAESLWKRRSGGVALRSLELQHSRHFRPHLHLQTTSARK